MTDIPDDLVDAVARNACDAYYDCVVIEPGPSWRRVAEAAIRTVYAHIARQGEDVTVNAEGEAFTPPKR